jgi:hypothetical protein
MLFLKKKMVLSQAAVLRCLNLRTTGNRHVRGELVFVLP